MRHYSKEEVGEAIRSTNSMTRAAKELGVSYTTFKRIAEEHKLFKPNQAGVGATNKGKIYKSAEDVFVEEPRSSQLLRKWLKIEKEVWECDICGISEWMGESLTLEVHHKDGNRSNNLRHNLQVLCPNCHSLTNNHKGRNISKRAISVSDEEILNAYDKEGSIRQALIAVGMDPKGANYNRVYEILAAR